MHHTRTSALQADINVTPLVDVCLVLLIIFMVVTPIIVNGVPVHLPKSTTSAATADATRTLPITVNEDGTLYVDSSAIRREQLAEILQARHTAHPDRPVVVRGDKHVKYGEVEAVLDACRKAGFTDVGLMTEK
jgi:TolR protein